MSEETNKIIINEIKINGEHLSLKTPLEFIYKLEDCPTYNYPEYETDCDENKLHTAYNEYLDLFSYTEYKNDIKEEIQHDIESLWESYVNVDFDKLPHCERDLRFRLLGFKLLGILGTKLSSDS
jgi:hypothetical protein